jgi:hypothetical protein
MSTSGNDNGSDGKPKFSTMTRSMFANTPPEIIAMVEANSGVSSDAALFDPEEEDYLAPDVAARMFLSNPASVGFNLMQFHILFDLTEQDIRDELAAKRLVAWSGSKPGQIGMSALVHGDDLMAWVNNPETPKRIRKKLQRVAGGEGAFFARRAKCVKVWVAPMR